MSFITVAPRTRPLRKPKGFEPAVQRWSVALPQRAPVCFIEFHAVQAADPAALSASGFLDYVTSAFSLPDAPTASDHARHVDEAGRLNHVVAAYWIDADAHARWNASAEVLAFWSDPARVGGACGFYRERYAVPAQRMETLYWQDYKAALSASPEVGFFPTPYCGYYGSMRDRIPIAAHDDLASSVGSLQPMPPASSEGRRLRVDPPGNLAVIRSATYWGQCDAEQMEDFELRLKRPLEGGMDFLRSNAVEAGCCSLRYQQSVDAAGAPLPEAHALGIFLSLAHLERWSEGHASHHSIFSAATARYRKYGARNQLRTWHEVYVVPEGQSFEYINCSPRTGLLPWFPAVEA